jgi:hypothetical protein
MKMWLASKAFKISGLDAGQIEALVLKECRTAADFQRIVFDEIARVQNMDRWADSSPNNIHFMPQIKKSFPDAQFVHIIRDGRNVALSIDKLGWSRPFIWEKHLSLMAAALYWRWTIMRGRAHSRTLGKDYLEISYEQLVSQPREALAKLSAFLRHDFDYDRIQEAAIGALNRPPTSFASELETKQFNPLDRWKTTFSPETLILLESLIGDMLKALGYPLATSDADLHRSLKVRRMRALYPVFFDFKQWLKRNTTLTRFFVDYDDILVDK